LHYKDFSLYSGVIPFRGGRFSEIKDGQKNKGNGIEILTDQVLVGSFVSWTKDNLTLQAGVATWQKEVNYRSLGDKNDNSQGYYFISKYEYYRHYLELNYFKINPNSVENSVEYKLGESDLISLGYIYSNLENGLVFWVEGLYSKIDENINETATNIVGAQAVPFVAQMGFLTEDATTEGASYKTGVAYKGFLGNSDYTIGYEYFRSYPGVISMNHGVVFNSNYSYWQLRDATMHTVFTHLELSKNIRLAINYSRSKNNQVPNFFSMSKTILPEHSLNADSFFTNNDRLYFGLEYKF
jgi:hypothetical protein